MAKNLLGLDSPVGQLDHDGDRLLAGCPAADELLMIRLASAPSNLYGSKLPPGPVSQRKPLALFCCASPLGTANPKSAVDMSDPFRLLSHGYARGELCSCQQAEGHRVLAPLLQM